MPFADRVEHAVHGRSERAHPHQVGVHEVDAELQADDVRGSVPDHPAHERVQKRAAAEAQVDQVGARPIPRGDAGQSRSVGRRRSPWLMELPWCSHRGRPSSGPLCTGRVPRGVRGSRSLSLSRSQSSTSFVPAGSAVKDARCSTGPWSRRRSRRVVCRSCGSVAARGVAACAKGAPSITRSDDSVGAGGESRHTRRGAAVRRDAISVAAVRKATRTPDGCDSTIWSLGVRGLGAGPRRQAVRADAVLCEFELGSAADESGERARAHRVKRGHGSCRRGFAGQCPKRVSSATIVSAQLSTDEGALWSKLR